MLKTLGEYISNTSVIDLNKNDATTEVELPYCDILWVYIYMKHGTTHFYHLALYNLVPGQTYFIKIQAVQMMNVIYGDMTLYSHATIIRG